MNYIAFSLAGENPTYNLGIIRNLQLLPLFYPREHWTPLVVTDFDSLPYSTIQELSRLAAGAFDVREPADPSFREFGCHFWRLAVLFRPEVLNDPGAVVVFRDADARPSEREAACTIQWVLDRPEAFHTMKDYPLHKSTIMAGLFGVKVREARRVGFMDEIRTRLPLWWAERSAENVRQDGEVSDEAFFRDCLGQFLRHTHIDDFRRDAPPPHRRIVGPPYDGPFLGEQVFIEGGKDVPDPKARQIRAESFR